jgi:hypothetical protein
VFPVARYVIRVSRALTAELTSAFPHMRSEVQPARTVLTGRFQDLEELAGVLNLIEETGASIVELIRIPEQCFTETAGDRPGDGRAR